MYCSGADTFRGEWPDLLEELLTKGEITAEQKKDFQYLNIVGLVGSIGINFSLWLASPFSIINLVI